LTPLILSGGDDEPDIARYQLALAFARELVEGVDFSIDESRNSVQLTSSGRQRLAEMVSVKTWSEADFLWQSRRARNELIEQALSALHLFRLDKHYIVAEGKVQIVDEYTGRVMPDRSWERGLHQMIEAKEGCEISGQRRTQARITRRVRSERMSRRLGGWLRWIAQRSAERLHARTRRDTVEQDKRFDKSLAFAGKSE
jgi:preprotein translocase subunit SecA